MALPYCPNCRAALPASIESWTCLNSKETDTTDESEFTDLGGAHVTDSSDSPELDPYMSEHDICGFFNKTGVECTQCRQPKTPGLFETSCPACKMDLPKIENCDPRTITITGPRGSGKTHYIIALNKWWSQHLNRFSLVAVPAMGERLKKAFKSFTDQVLRSKKTLPATPAGKMISFSWHVKPTDGSSLGILFTLPDVSGEGLMSSRNLLKNRYYHHTSGIIFLIDADRMILTDNPSAQVSGKNLDPADHFEVASALIADFERRVDTATMRNTPIAICVNKLDKLGAYDARWDELAREYIPSHEGFFDGNTCYHRSNAIRDILFTDPDLAPALSLLEASFDNVMYFIIATIGSDTDQVRMVPIAVEDPFLFHLWHLNYIPVNNIVES